MRITFLPGQQTEDCRDTGSAGSVIFFVCVFFSAFILKYTDSACDPFAHIDFTVGFKAAVWRQ